MKRKLVLLNGKKVLCRKEMSHTIFVSEGFITNIEINGENMVLSGNLERYNHKTRTAYYQINEEGKKCLRPA